MNYTRQKTKDKRQKTKDKRQKTKDKRQKTKDKRQKKCKLIHFFFISDIFKINVLFKYGNNLHNSIPYLDHNMILFYTLSTFPINTINTINTIGAS